MICSDMEEVGSGADGMEILDKSMRDGDVRCVGEGCCMGEGDCDLT